MTDDAWTPPDGWTQTARRTWRHTSGARCLFAVDHRVASLHVFAWVAVSAAGELVGAFTSKDGWLQAAMAKAVEP